MLNFSEPQFPESENGGEQSACLARLVQELDGVTQEVLSPPPDTLVTSGEH